MADDAPPEITARPEPLPLDSPDWMPIAEAHRLLCRPTGNRLLAAKDLTDAMADEDEDRRVPSLRRCFTHGIRRKADGSYERALVGPECELLPREYWIEHEVQSWSDATFVTRRSNTPASIKHYAYFVWKPALAKLWPSAFASLAPPPSPPAKEPREYELIREIAAAKYPQGYEHIENPALIKAVGDEFEGRGLEPPKRDKVLRALDRRKG